MGRVQQQKPRWADVLKHLRKPAVFVLALIFGLAVYWMMLHRTHVQMYDQERTSTQRLATQTAQALSLQINAVVKKLDYFSSHLGHLWLNSQPQVFDNTVRVTIETLPPDALVQVAVADPQGAVKYVRQAGAQALFSPEPAVSIADREHFNVHETAGRSEMFISTPVLGRISQQWTIQFSRGLWHDGRFAGVVVLSVSAEHLAGALKAIFPDAIDAASLVNAQGIYLARSYYLSDVLGKTLPATRPFLQYPDQQEGAYEVVADVDKTDRLYSWHRVPDYPLVVLVGLGADKALALTRQAIHDSHWQSGFGSALLFLAGLALAWLWVQRSWRAEKLKQVAEALRASQTRLRVALDAVRDGLWAYDHATDTLFWDEHIRTMLGYGSDYSALSLSTLEGLMHPADASLMAAPLSRNRDQGYDLVLNVELRLRRADGRWLWVHVRGRSVENSGEGQPLRSVGTLSDISERVAENRLRDALLNRSAAAVVLVSHDRTLVQANAQFKQIFLRPDQSIKGFDLRAIHLDDAHWNGLAAGYDLLRKKGELRMEYPLVDARGQLRWFDMHAVYQDPDDPFTHVVWTWIDISSRHAADAALKLETRRLNTLLERFPGGVLIEDARAVVVFVNDLWSALFGLTGGPTELLGLNDAALRERLGPEVAAWLRVPRGAADNRAQMRAGRDVQVGDGALQNVSVPVTTVVSGPPATESRRSHDVTTRHGRHLEIDHVEIFDEGAYLGSVWLVRDITERKHYELELARMASTDTLTGLPNRRSFMSSLTALCAQAGSGEPGAAGVVLMLDIDHFKRVNDTYGHAVGDLVLKQVARVMCSALRSTDVPGRLGGEEFAIMLPHIGCDEGLAVAERIRASVQSATVQAEGHTIQVTISIGVAQVSACATADELLQQADEALYEAKQTGRNRVCSACSMEGMGIL